MHSDIKRFLFSLKTVILHGNRRKGWKTTTLKGVHGSEHEIIHMEKMGKQTISLGV